MHAADKILILWLIAQWFNWFCHCPGGIKGTMIFSKLEELSLTNLIRSQKGEILLTTSHSDGKEPNCLVPSSMECSCLRWELVFSCSPLSVSCSYSVGVLSAVLQTTLNYMADIQQPKLVLIVGAIGLTLNLISATFLHGMWYCAFYPARLTRSRASWSWSWATSDNWGPYKPHGFR